MMRAIGILILTAALTACAHNAPQPLSKSTRAFSAVTIEWQSSRHAAERRCQEEGAPRAMTIHACAVHEGARCRIIAVEPAHWRDHPALSKLGHELWHCLGAQHRETY